MAQGEVFPCDAGAVGANMANIKGRCLVWEKDPTEKGRGTPEDPGKGLVRGGPSTAREELGG